MKSSQSGKHRKVEEGKKGRREEGKKSCQEQHINKISESVRVAAIKQTEKSSFTYIRGMCHWTNMLGLVTFLQSQDILLSHENLEFHLPGP